MDLRLAIGLGLVGGAAYLGRRGSLEAAITPGMSDQEFAREVQNLSRKFAIKVDEARFNVQTAKAWQKGTVKIFGIRQAADPAQKASMCKDVELDYYQALNFLQDARAVHRNPRMELFVKRCSGRLKPTWAVTAGSHERDCWNIRAAVDWMKDGMESLRHLKTELSKNCKIRVRPIPLSGMR